MIFCQIEAWLAFYTYSLTAIGPSTDPFIVFVFITVSSTVVGFYDCDITLFSSRV